jgi:hypothetical protein
MTAEEWERCTYPEPMLEFLRASGLASDRKRRLFSCACLRRCWHLVTDERCRHAVQVAERLADGWDRPEELAEARALAKAACREADYAVYREEFEVFPYKDRMTPNGVLAWTAGAAQAALAAELVEPFLVRAIGREPSVDPEGRRLRRVEVLGPSRHAVRAAGCAGRLAVWAEASPRDAESLRRILKSAQDTAERYEQEQQASLLRDLFHPSHPLAAAPCLPAGPGDRVYRLAGVVYTARRFEDLPVLADMLEEAGLTDAELLGHLRGPGPHVLGCHALDAVLGKA